MIRGKNLTRSSFRRTRRNRIGPILLLRIRTVLRHVLGLVILGRRRADALRRHVRDALLRMRLQIARGRGRYRHRSRCRSHALSRLHSLGLWSFRSRVHGLIPARSHRSIHFRSRPASLYPTVARSLQIQRIGNPIHGGTLRSNTKGASLRVNSLSGVRSRACQFLRAAALARKRYACRRGWSFY